MDREQLNDYARQVSHLVRANPEYPVNEVPLLVRHLGLDPSGDRQVTFDGKPHHVLVAGVSADVSALLRAVCQKPGVRLVETGESLRRWGLPAPAGLPEGRLRRDGDHPRPTYVRMSLVWEERA